MSQCTFRLARVVTLILALGAVAPSAAWSQDGAQAPETPQALAPFDLTGNWVSVVTEDWRWRMVTPPQGDFSSIPLNEEGERLVNEQVRRGCRHARAWGLKAATSQAYIAAIGGNLALLAKRLASAQQEAA